MSREVGSPSTATLERHRATEPSKPPHPYRRLIIVVSVIAVVIILAILTNGVAAFAALVLFPFVFMFWRIRNLRRQRSRATTEEEFESQWRDRENKKAQLVTAAEKTYARGLFGKWRDAVVSLRHHGTATTLDEERALLLVPDAPCAFHWRWFDPPLNVASVFFVQFQQPGQLLVQMQSPELPGWHEVSYTFSVRKNWSGDLELAIRFESDNPLSEDQQDSWPFTGAYTLQP